MPQIAGKYERILQIFEESGNKQAKRICKEQLTIGVPPHSHQAKRIL